VRRASKKTPDGFLTPTYPSDPDGQDMNLYDPKFDAKLLKAPEVSTDDFFSSLARIKPSVAEADLEL